MTISRRDFLISSTLLASNSYTTSAIAKGVQPIAPKSPRMEFDQLEMLLNEAVSAGNTPGIALAVWKNGKEVYSRTVGMANLETESRVVDTSVFRIGSLTKQFAGALVMKLVALGKLSLSDQAQKYLPFMGKHESFTILELLNHTAGVHDGDYGSTSPKAVHSQFKEAERIAQQNPFFDFPPGTAWLYSNANYILIGAIIEQVTGMPLAEAAAMLLFKPLGLHNTAFDTSSEIIKRRVSGYSSTGNTGNQFQNAEYLEVELAGAAGAMRSTASDLCRWQHALFQGQALPASQMAAMTMLAKLRNGQLTSTNRFSVNDKPMGDIQYGLGLFLDTTTKDKSLIANHHGGINGFASYLASHPASGLGFACLCNIDTHPGLPFRNLRKKVFKEILQSNPV